MGWVCRQFGRSQCRYLGDGVGCVQSTPAPIADNTQTGSQRHIWRGQPGGTLAAIAGAGLVAGVAVLFSQAGLAPASSIKPIHQLLIITGAGWIGSLVDSLLGATLQVIYFCPACEKETERHPLHGCGEQTTRVRGLLWMNNDWVNAACTVSAGILGVKLVLFK